MKRSEKAAIKQLIEQYRKARLKWDIEWDRENNRQGQLVMAATAVLNGHGKRPAGWDAAIWDKQMNKPLEERLVIAGSLILSELERLEAHKPRELRAE